MTSQFARLFTTVFVLTLGLMSTSHATTACENRQTLTAEGCAAQGPCADGFYITKHKDQCLRGETLEEVYHLSCSIKDTSTLLLAIVANSATPADVKNDGSTIEATTTVKAEGLACQGTALVQTRSFVLTKMLVTLKSGETVESNGSFTKINGRYTCECQLR